MNLKLVVKAPNSNIVIKCLEDIVMLYFTIIDIIINTNNKWGKWRSVIMNIFAEHEPN